MSGKKTKIALCISGEPRSSMFCFPYIYESFINLGPQYEVDVYIHSWKGYRAIDLYKPKKYLIDRNSHLDFIHQTSNRIQLRSFTEFSSIKNSISMIWSLKKCFDLIEESYDFYIRLRPDIIFPYKFNLNNLLLDFNKNPYDIYIPSPTTQTYTSEVGYNDQMAIANFKGMHYYSNFLNFFEKNYSFIKGNFIEGYLKHYLDLSNLKIKTLENIGNNVLVRSTEIVTNAPNSFIYLDE